MTLHEKRERALNELEAFKEWHGMVDEYGKIPNNHDAIIAVGLFIDIKTCEDPDELDRLFDAMHERNMRRMNKKMME